MFSQILRKNKNWLRQAIRFFVWLNNYSYHQISGYAGILGGGIHPKYAIMNYPQFFIDNVSSTQNILDVGCGVGVLADRVAGKAERVVGIDIKAANIDEANRRYKRENLQFLVGDATTYEFDTNFDAIILSNVLEHIDKRVEFLQKLRPVSNTILLRVPMITRDWLVVYKRDSGFEYRLDPTHFIEYTYEGLKGEVESAGWEIVSYQLNWGEFWGVLRRKEV